VLTRIPSDAIIFSQGPDQIFSADRLTSFYLPSSEESWRVFAGIVQRRPTYFLIDVRGRSVASWNTEAKQYGLTITADSTNNGYVLAHVTN